MIYHLLTKVVPNFSKLAKHSTSRAPIFKGLLPTFSTIFTLLLLSLGITTGVLLWTGLLASLTAFVPLYAKTLAGIAGLALLNFFLSREVTTGLLNAREIRTKFKFDAHNVTDIREMVDSIRQALNARYREK